MHPNCGFYFYNQIVAFAAGENAIKQNQHNEKIDEPYGIPA